MADKMFSVYVLIFFALLIVLLYVKIQRNPDPPSPKPEPRPNPDPSPEPPSIGGCKGTMYGCCLDGKVACVDRTCSNCKSTNVKNKL